MTQPQLSDQLQRDQALDTSRSCCVQAPAGSGKTELLTQRLLKLLALAQRPEEILSITFTRKAAYEMRNRLLDNLEQARSLSDSDLKSLDTHQQHTMAMAKAVLARDHELGWNLANTTSRLRITTIDSFNQFLVNQLPVTASLGLLPDITVKPGELFRQAVRDLMKALESDGRLGQELAVLLSHFNNRWNSLEDQLCNLLHSRDQWLGYILSLRRYRDSVRPPMEETLQEIICSTLNNLRLAFLPYQATLLPHLEFAAGNLDLKELPPESLKHGFPDADNTSLAAWQALMRIILKTDGDIRKTVRASEGFPAPSSCKDKLEAARLKQHKEDFLAQLEQLSGDVRVLDAIETFLFIPASHFDDSQWRVLESLTVILPELVSRLSLIFSRQRKTDHTLISAAALESLGDDEHPTDLAMRLDYNLKHILVDEFQDTSSMQIQLLARLTSGWQPGDGRTLFIVGDGMQSCYGFRNARVGLFLAARDYGIGDIRFNDLRLDSNFRSEEGVVNWCNRVFAGAFPVHDDISRGGVSFNPASPTRPSTAYAGVRTLLVCADKETELDKQTIRRQEAQLVADEVEKLTTCCPDDSIAILVRYRSHLRDLIPVLQERKIPWQASEIDPLSSYPLINDLLTLTRAMLKTSDNIAWLALFRTPLFGLAMADIHHLSRLAVEHDTSLWEVFSNADLPADVSEEGRLIVNRTSPHLIRALQERQRLPLRDWIENLWLMLCGKAVMGDSPLETNLQQFFNLLEEHDAGGDIVDLHLFETELGALYGGDQQPGARLQIMTIHKAKGLEFHHVILPGLDRGTPRQDSPLLLWKEHITAAGEDRVVISLPARKGRDRDKDPVYHYLKCETELEERLEATRLLYIGVTRAIRQAILVACASRENGDLVAPPKNSLLSRIWQQLSEDDITQIPVDVQPDESRHQSPDALRSRRLPPSWPGQTYVLQEESPSSTTQEDPPHRNLVERCIGDIIHECLQQVALGQMDLTDTNVLSPLEPFWLVRLEKLTREPDKALADIRRQLQACLKHERFDWLFDPEHRSAGAEVALSDFSRGGRREYIIDRTFIDSSGSRWIIDYKSSRPRDGESIEAFTRRQEQQYREQLEIYCRLYQTMESHPVRCALFFTGIPHFHEIDLQITQNHQQNSLF